MKSDGERVGERGDGDGEEVGRRRTSREREGWGVGERERKRERRRCRKTLSLTPASGVRAGPRSPAGTTENPFTAKPKPFHGVSPCAHLIG